MERWGGDEREWLEADGHGGFASGTVSGVRTRRYHGLLLAAMTPPTGRMMLVSGFDAWIETAAGRFALSSQRYAPDVVHPDGRTRIVSFTNEPWPTWVFALEDETRVRQEIVASHGMSPSTVVVTWRLEERLDGRHSGGHLKDEEAVAPGVRPGARLRVRPFLSGRDYHATHHENGDGRTDARVTGGLVIWQPYDSVPAVISGANARYQHEPDWYRRFEYVAERARGLDDVEDLWSPGWLTWDLTSAEAVWCLQAGSAPAAAAVPQPTSVSASASADPVTLADRVRADERTRRAVLPSPLHRAADAYIVRRNAGRTIVAGYPWFTDWGRDTFIAMRGLCLSTGRYDIARDILVEWSTTLSEGMLPNRFPDAGAAPEYNAVDASLWFIIAVRDLCAIADADPAAAGLPSSTRQTLLRAVQAILGAYTCGTRYGIRCDEDGLLACGLPGVPLTWMDARVGDRAVTPRVGKPVEVQALWLHALRFGARDDRRWTPLYEHGRRAFASRFWNEADACLYDVVDVDHERGRVDASIRPNQILAVGGLSDSLLDPARARLVVARVERDLLTPLGLRSLAPVDAAYRPHYGGGPDQRDAAYHQGIVWPWLMGAFVDAWLRVRGIGAGADANASADAVDEARRRFLTPLMSNLEQAGLGHVSEIADAEPPFTPGGCPFQAWSLGELLRIHAWLVPDRPPRAERTARASAE